MFFPGPSARSSTRSFRLGDLVECAPEYVPSTPFAKPPRGAAVQVALFRRQGAPPSDGTKGSLRTPQQGFEAKKDIPEGKAQVKR